MKNKIILILFGVIVGLCSFLLGILWKEKEINSYLAHHSIISDSFRVSTYYYALKKYDEGNEEEAINSLRSWMETDIQFINSYREHLSDDERKRIDGLLQAVEPHREKPNKSNHH